MSLVWGVSTLVLAGCSVISSIDVCERGEPEEHQINRYTAGSQAIHYPEALAVMPNGLTFLAFSSQLYQGNETVPQHVRGTLIDGAGAPVATCGESQGYFYAPDRDLSVEGRHRYAPVVAPPGSDAEVGLLVYIGEETDHDGHRVYARQIDAAACPMAEEIRIDSREGYWVSRLAVVPTGREHFLVLWSAIPTDIRSNDYALRARVVHGRHFEGIKSLPTMLSTEGAPVTLSPRAHAVVTVDATAIEGDQAALVWQTWRDSVFSTWFAVYNDRLEVIIEPREIATQPDILWLPTPTQVALSWGSDSALITWGALDGVGTPRIFALFLSLDGEMIREPFLVSDGAAGEELRAASSISPTGTFVVAWDAVGSSTSPDQSEHGVQLLAMTGAGERRFLNPACGASEVQANIGRTGSQISSALTFLPDGSLLVVWNDGGENGLDLSGYGIRGVVWSERLLFPVE